MKPTFFFALAIACALTLASTQPAQAGGCDHPQVVTLALTGTVSSAQQIQKGSDGRIRTVTVYYLRMADEDVLLPQPKSHNTSAAANLNLANFDGQRVRLIARGYKQKSKTGTESTHVHEVFFVERMQA